jgi:hypothetical protein
MNFKETKIKSSKVFANIDKESYSFTLEDEITLEELYQSFKERYDRENVCGCDICGNFIVKG